MSMSSTPTPATGKQVAKAFGNDLNKLRTALGLPKVGDVGPVVLDFARAVGHDGLGLRVLNGELTLNDYKTLGDALQIRGFGSMPPGDLQNANGVLKNLTRIASLHNFLGDSNHSFDKMVGNFVRKGVDGKKLNPAELGGTLLRAMTTGQGPVGESLQEVMQMFSDKDAFAQRVPHLACVVHDTPLEGVVEMCVANLMAADEAGKAGEAL